MSYTKKSCNDFIEELSSKAAVPGGGGASALAGAVGTALGSMVANLTTGKEKYAVFEDDIQKILKETKELQEKLMRLIDEDAEVFLPLSKAYGIPKDDPTRDEIMEKALVGASEVPLEIMRACADAIKIHKELSEKGSVMAMSDVGAGVVLCKAAMQGASMNVYINAKSMKNRKVAAAVTDEANKLLEEYCRIADEVFASVKARYS
ncbi:MAG: cyclodeaminase/cyclohydrolase family protein [Oscillospiraceae bacterium]|nr:cyclodeaminase/cyclohydrolase family protein [Oscillospiraceae bacterium]